MLVFFGDWRKNLRVKNEMKNFRVSLVKKFKELHVIKNFINISFKKFKNRDFLHYIKKSFLISRSKSQLLS